MNVPPRHLETWGRVADHVSAQLVRTEPSTDRARLDQLLALLRPISGAVSWDPVNRDHLEALAGAAICWALTLPDPPLED